MSEYTVETYLDTWGISKNGFPLLQVNKFLMEHSEKTAKRYAFELKKYLEYLNKRGIDYAKAQLRDVKAFLLEITYHSTTIGQITKGTQQQYKTVINMFYKFLMAELNLEQEMLSPDWTHSNKSFFYGQITTYLDSRKEKKRNRLGHYTGQRKWRFKAKRTYRKWYTELEIEALASNFKALRDKVIFLVSVRLGCRIEEILTMKYKDFDWEEQVLYVSKSKTFTRHLAVEDDLDALVKQYCQTERCEIESQVGECEYLFLNQKMNKGEKMKYHNFRQILKGCAKRAGMNPEKVITHAGRSTRASEIAKMIRMGIEGVTEQYLITTMGWSTSESAKPYLKMLDIDELRDIARRISEKRKVAIRRR